MPTTRLDVKRFLLTASSYSDKALKKADKDKSGYVTAAELKKLPKDLRDNAQKYADVHGRVPVAMFKAAFVAYARANLQKVDRNKDGVLTSADIARLPTDLKDNVKAYVAASKPVWNDGGTAASTVKDKTTASRISDHERSYGSSRISEKTAFNLGVKAILADREYGPGGTIKENDGSLTDAQIAAELKKDFKSMELLPKGQAEESMADPAKSWIFRVTCNDGSDYGYWVSINRQSGEAEINSFN
jgi:hypothetical protein